MLSDIEKLILLRLTYFSIVLYTFLLSDVAPVVGTYGQVAKGLIWPATFGYWMPLNGRVNKVFACMVVRRLLSNVFMSFGGNVVPVAGGECGSSGLDALCLM